MQPGKETFIQAANGPSGSRRALNNEGGRKGSPSHTQGNNFRSVAQEPLPDNGDLWVHPVTSGMAFLLERFTPSPDPGTARTGTGLREGFADQAEKDVSPRLGEPHVCRAASSSSLNVQLPHVPLPSPYLVSWDHSVLFMGWVPGVG